MKSNEDREKYLEITDRFIKDHGYVRPLEISEYLKVTPASVSQMLTKLSEDGLIIYHKYRGMTISEKGAKVLNELEKKEGSIYDLLRLIGCDERTARERACFFEHFIDDDLAEKMKAFTEKMRGSGIKITA